MCLNKEMRINLQQKKKKSIIDDRWRIIDFYLQFNKIQIYTLQSQLSRQILVDVLSFIFKSRFKKTNEKNKSAQKSCKANTRNFENAKFSGSRLKLNFVDFGFLNEYQSAFDIIRGTIIHNEFIT